MAYLLGLDISTTGAKALLIDERGTVIGSHTTPQPISTPKPLWSEQNPADWWDGIAASIRAVLEATGVGGDSIRAIGLTGQMLELAENSFRGHGGNWSGLRCLGGRGGLSAFEQLVVALELLGIIRIEPDVIAEAVKECVREFGLGM